MYLIIRQKNDTIFKGLEVEQCEGNKPSLKQQQQQHAVERMDVTREVKRKKKWTEL